MKKLELQFLQAELNRISEWIRFSDKKSVFLSVYYSAVFGILISQKEKIENLISNLKSLYFYLFILLIILIFLSFSIGLFFLKKSIFPRLKNDFTDKSLFYFGNIAKMKFIDFLKNMGKLTEEESKKQIAEQIYTNSIIADQKMKNVQNSIKALFILTIFVAILSLI